MSIAGQFGAHPILTRRWLPQIAISGGSVGSTPPGDYVADPTLPTLGTDPFNSAARVVIPLGRFVSIGTSQSLTTGGNGYQIGPAWSGKTPITLNDGRYHKPQGMAVTQIYGSEGDEFMTGENTAQYRTGFLAELPFVLSVNNAHGALFAGDRLAGYFGQTASNTTSANHHKGKPVKWVPKEVYHLTTSASAAIQLTAAIYPGIQPRIIATLDSGGGALSPTSTLTWSDGFAKWVVSFTGTGSGSVTQVIYAFGQDADQIAGHVQRIYSIQEVLNNHNFLKWVEYAPSDMLNFPPAAERYPVTAVSQETPSTVVANSQYRVASYPISIHHTVLVEVTGVQVTDSSGSTSTYAAGTWFPLPTTAVIDQRNQFMGLYHAVNWRTGVIQLFSNLTAISGFDIRVTYSYITSPQTASVLWGGGLLNLSDGRYLTTGVQGASSTTNPYGSANYLTPTTTPYGVPAHLNLSDVVGAMRLWVN